MKGKIILVFYILAAGMFLPAQARKENPLAKDTLLSSIPPPNKNGTAIISPEFNHRLNFRYPGERKGLKPYIAPVILISGGTALHFMTGTKENVRDVVRENFPYQGHFDDYA